MNDSVALSARAALHSELMCLQLISLPKSQLITLKLKNCVASTFFSNFSKGMHGLALPLFNMLFFCVFLWSCVSSLISSNKSLSVFLAQSGEPTDVPASVSFSCFSTAALGPESSSWIEAMRNGAAEDCLCLSASSMRTKALPSRKQWVFHFTFPLLTSGGWNPIIEKNQARVHLELTVFGFAGWNWVFLDNSLCHWIIKAINNN